MVLLWEWRTIDENQLRVDAPEIRRGFAFEAFPIAQARDLGWLSKGRIGQIKAIDLITPVIGNSTTFREEEHNMGKLMRILDNEEVSRLPSDLLDHTSVRLYREFTSFVLSAGLAYSSVSFFRAFGLEVAEPEVFIHSPTTIQTIVRGMLSGTEVVISAAGRLSRRKLDAYTTELYAVGIRSAIVLIFNEKFSWSIYHFDDESWQKLFNGKKPGLAILKMGELLGL